MCDCHHVLEWFPKLQFVNDQSWSNYLLQTNFQWFLVIVELGLVIYLLRANVHTPAEQLAFDLIATVGVAGLMSRLSNLRKKVSQ